jgi:tryptophan synthase alpha subunit
MKRWLTGGQELRGGKTVNEAMHKAMNETMTKEGLLEHVMKIDDSTAFVLMMMTNQSRRMGEALKETRSDVLKLKVLVVLQALVYALVYFLQNG